MCGTGATLVRIYSYSPSSPPLMYMGLMQCTSQVTFFLTYPTLYGGGREGKQEEREETGSSETPLPLTQSLEFCWKSSVPPFKE